MEKESGTALNKTKVALVLCMVVLAVAVGSSVVFHLGGGVGTGGPESVRPVEPARINGWPGTGGPESVRPFSPVRWLLMPAMGGPE